jgi:myo-inositol-1(or 4)-monophosphatase
MIGFLRTIAREAGALLNGYSGQSLGRSEKAGAGFVTEADLASERYLVKAILERYPTASIIAEEGSGRSGRDDLAFIIDPLDGTTNFAHGIPEHAVCIGVEKAGSLVAGVVYNPARDIMYAAESGHGAFRNDRRLVMAEPPAMEASLIGTGDIYHRGEAFQPAIDALTKIYRAARVARTSGSLALVMCQTADGTLDGSWNDYFNAWDIAAATVIVREAGGTVLGRGEGFDHRLPGWIFAGTPRRVKELRNLVFP